MAVKLDYVVRETTTNLRRNITLTLAAIVAMAVSLSLFGSALLLQFGVDNLSSRWEKGVEVIVFLQREILPEQQDALEDMLNDHPEVISSRFVNDEESREEFRRLFQGNEAMLARLEANPDLLPTSFRVDPRTSNPEAIESLTAQFATEEGVLRASSSIDAIRTVERVSNWIRMAILIAAVILLVAALLLILNTIRMAMFARRREIEVMKLVGATNWFIRVPFMLEGVVQGVAGSACALSGIYFLNRFLNDVGGGDSDLTMLRGLVASQAEVLSVMIAVVFLGVVIGAAGSGWAVSRFLRV